LHYAQEKPLDEEQEVLSPPEFPELLEDENVDSWISAS